MTVLEQERTTTAPGRRAFNPLRLWPLAVVAVLACVPFIVDDYTLITGNRVLSLGLLAASVALLTGTAGLPSLGQAAPYGIGAYLAYNLAELDWTFAPLQVVAAAAAGALFNAVTGPVVVRTRGVVFLMVTLAVGEIAVVAAGKWESVTNGTDGTGRIPPGELIPGEPLVDDANLYWYALGVAVVVITAMVLVQRSRGGKLLHGSRDNEMRMRASGHRVSGYLLLTYIAAGAIAGVGGSVLATTQRYVSPSDMDFSVAALILLAVVIGGAFSITGALAGVLLVIVARDLIGNHLPGQGPLLLGILFIVAVYLLPNGLAGRLGDLTRLLTRKRDREEAT
ncbi:branched-chain amino acid ABC transporter permease [Stackebrandtia nassauensis]|uniref:Inner-membrane translocator n=1 Tax=Stackebrandtia nassauensis (strain DSM 44728 / CIP 108903 / NRRL B-16338 / NBRC 102104 / LLR-40K-21) TaxID=446470 RepID=D3Q8E9_STANL|nr:branched-chain amino acid ABC transporter permease [Stackebrandtia nassauensis]ADD42523.1 inner-membrane translocator [Stackebrandtia nassauensis DSM 44728]